MSEWITDDIQIFSYENSDEEISIEENSDEENFDKEN